MESNKQVYTNIPDFILKFKQISQLYMDNHNISDITGISKLPNLTYLHLNNNSLTNLPNEFFQITTLKDLAFANNQIKELNPLVGNLVDLDALNMRNNNLRSLPVELNNIKSPGRFTFRDNYINSNNPESFPVELKNRFSKFLGDQKSLINNNQQLTSKALFI